MNKNRYYNRDKTPFVNGFSNPIILSDEIHKYLKQISNVQIDHTLSNYFI
jgi:hypothetical protein